ncbi:MAG TPA: hemerythrin domain-containing protein [Pyrinomonadaceae bacterium]|nr:hemerythrin domain-containing protein [Pyrinomonadaceae bacterium]
MLAKGSQRLADDHVAADKLLKQIQAAIDNGEVSSAYEKLDLFWAKLAVHIRAEHLHLFPALTSSVDENVITQLRADHEFFMRELANAVEAMRTLSNVSDRDVIDKGLDIVRQTMIVIEQKLEAHNQREESGVYRLAETVLDADAQAELAKEISRELENRPPRFASNVW